MHLQQTKRRSISTGGPQYYFHNLSEPVKLFLRTKGAVNVALVTPYGATKSNYIAVSKDHKLSSKGNPIVGKVGHDRIQQGRADSSIGEAIRIWYKLRHGNFEKIDIDIDIIDDIYYLTPLTYKYVSKKIPQHIERIDRPLTFCIDYISPLWIHQLKFVNKKYPGIINWSLNEICRIVYDHHPNSKLAHILEPDLLRASGPLKHFGFSLGGYVGKGFDCYSSFSFLNYPNYNVPVEVKRNSKDFSYQQKKYGKELLSRVIILCAFHDHKNVPRNIDVIELAALCKYAATL